jgi:hypothetical protein
MNLLLENGDSQLGILSHPFDVSWKLSSLVGKKALQIQDRIVDS